MPNCIFEQSFYEKHLSEKDLLWPRQNKFAGAWHGTFTLEVR
jgi:hypothetical protein